MPRRIVGPLGIWDFPILNAILELIERWRERRIARLGSARVSARTRRSLTPTMANVEVWEWEDYRGRKRKIVARRQVEELS